VTFDALLARLEMVRRLSPTEAYARCPSHHDNDPSLHVTATADELLLHDFGGCQTREVLAELGLGFPDLRLNGSTTNAHGKTEPRIVARYAYQDEGNTLLFEVVRYAPKAFRQRRPDGQGGWIWKLGDTRRVLYRLPHLSMSTTLFHAEGEQDADGLAARGWNATTSAGGANAWRDELADQATAAGVEDVVVFPDSDTPGAAYAEAVAASYSRRGLRVKVVALPAKDVSNYLAVHSLADLAVLVEQTPWRRDASPSRGNILRGREITSTTVAEPDWVVHRLFSAAHQHMIVAASQGGKTWTLFDLGVAIASPEVAVFLGQPVRHHGRVVVESWEQGQQEDLRKIQKVIAGHGLPFASNDLILISDATDSLNSNEYFSRRVQDLKDCGAIAYLMDSLSEGAGIELNDNTMYSEWWRSRIKPILDLGCMVVFTHLRGHRKAGVAADRDSASRGATQIRALSTAVLEMRQLTDTTFQVRHNKHRNGTALPFGVLELEGKPEDRFVRLALRADTTLAAEGKALLARRLLADLGRSHPGVWLTRAAIEDGVNGKSKPTSARVSRRMFEPVLAEMTSEAMFEKTKQGRADAWRWIGVGCPDEDEE
jgi:AAA domain/Toprim-like